MSQTVLICDDAIFMRTMIGDILTQAGFQIVAEAETGAMRLRRERVDVAISELVAEESELLASLSRADQERLSALLRKLSVEFDG